MCTEGQKFNNTNSFDGSGSFDLYINDLTHTGNVILAKSKSLTTFYITLDNPNYLKSNDKLICDYAEKWMHKIESYSDRITNSNSRSSMRLFSILNEKIAQSEKLIKVLI
jgi:hypothetical protein